MVDCQASFSIVFFNERSRHDRPRLFTKNPARVTVRQVLTLYPPKKPAMKAKLNRAQITEGLKQIPVETLLFGSVREAGKRITPKQKKFVEKIVLEGKNKTQAYREAYDTASAPPVQSVAAAQVARNSRVALYREALERAVEAQKYQTPAHLRALVIHELTSHALDESIAPAQRLKALQLLGTVSEVAAFTERREVVQVKDADAARSQLMAAIREAVTANATDAQVVDADSLLAELTAGQPADPAALTLDADADAMPGSDTPTDAESMPADAQATATDAAHPAGENSPA